MKLFVLYLSLSFSLLTNANEYYRCESNTGVAFSQFPCPENARQNKNAFKTVNTSSKPFADSKQLTAFTNKQKRLFIKNRIIAKQEKLKLLEKEYKKTHQTLTFRLEQLQKIPRKKEKRIRITNEMNQLKLDYLKQKKLEKTQISKLQKQLKSNKSQ